jgi:hypothetical protein
MLDALDLDPLLAFPMPPTQHLIPFTSYTLYIDAPPPATDADVGVGMREVVFRQEDLRRCGFGGGARC